MTPLLQNGKPICGQCCLAALLDHPNADAVIEKIGARPLWQKEMRAALESYGFKVGTRQRFVGKLPEYAMLWMRMPGARK